jgi:hypothetical protein
MMGVGWGLDFNLPAHQLREQEVAGGAEFLVLEGERFALEEAAFSDLAEMGDKLRGGQCDFEI